MTPFDLFSLRKQTKHTHSAGFLTYGLRFVAAFSKCPVVFSRKKQIVFPAFGKKMIKPLNGIIATTLPITVAGAAYRFSLYSLLPSVAKHRVANIVLYVKFLARGRHIPSSTRNQIPADV